MYLESRASTNIIFSQHQNTTYLYLFGGYTFDQINGMKKITTLNDNWVYILQSNRWMEVFPNSNNPSSRYGSKMVELDENNIVLFGGFDLDSTLNDLWLFNRETNMWTEIKNYNQTNIEEVWPKPIRDFTMIKFLEVNLSFLNVLLNIQGILVYGGEYIVPILGNTTVSISENSKRFSFPLNEVWILNLNNCLNKCSNHGKCNYGRCICNKGYFGPDCSITYCKNSYCITDSDNWSYQNCFHCSGHGNIK